MRKSKLLLTVVVVSAGMIGADAAFAAKSAATSSPLAVQSPMDPFALKARAPITNAVHLLARAAKVTSVTPAQAVLVPSPAPAVAGVREPYRPPNRSPYRPAPAGPFQ